MNLFIRRLQREDAEIISRAFARIGWTKSVEKYQECYKKQQDQQIIVLVAESEGVFAGYLQVVWDPGYFPFPEIQDLNVLPDYRRKGIATALMDEAEALIAQRSNWAGIGVGLHPGYNAAQRMYALRGYVPDGKGVTWNDVYIEEGQQLVADDDLVLHLIKELHVDG